VLSIVYPHEARTIVRIAPAHEAVVSWNTRAPRGRIELTAYRADGQVSSWLPYVSFSPQDRRSLNGRDEVASLETDILSSGQSMVAIEVRCDAALDAIAISTPVHAPRPTIDANGLFLDVPALSQYLPAFPGERGWCSPAALAMLLNYWGGSFGVADVAAGVRDTAYGGTGNWAFNVAFAGEHGLRAAVVHLDGIAHAAAFIASGIPLALSFSWKEAELPSAPLGHSDGHLAVLRGFTKHGHPQFNDPAHPDLTTMYDRAAFARVWERHGGIAYALVPQERSNELLRLANG
jgi:hypothetical protein